MKAVFPGSFDPPTSGHKEVIRQAAALFDELIVAIAVNPEKKPFFPVAVRKAMLARMTAGKENIRVLHYEGLTATCAVNENARFLVRGLRDARDLAYEKELAYGNELLANGLRTVFFIASHDHYTVSSRLVREVIRCGGGEAALPFVPVEIHDQFQKYCRDHEQC